MYVYVARIFAVTSISSGEWQCYLWAGELQGRAWCRAWVRVKTREASSRGKPSHWSVTLTPRWMAAGYSSAKRNVLVLKALGSLIAANQECNVLVDESLLPWRNSLLLPENVLKSTRAAGLPMQSL